jgi:hypothetical protein
MWPGGEQVGKKDEEKDRHKQQMSSSGLFRTRLWIPGLFLLLPCSTPPRVHAQITLVSSYYTSLAKKEPGWRTCPGAELKVLLLSQEAFSGQPLSLSSQNLLKFDLLGDPRKVSTFLLDYGF